MSIRLARLEPSPDIPKSSFLFLLATLFLLILLYFLLGLQGRVVNVPHQYALQDDGDQHNEENGEEDGLVIEDGDGLWCSADLAEPVELTHLSGVVIQGREMRRNFAQDVDGQKRKQLIVESWRFVSK